MIDKLLSSKFTMVQISEVFCTLHFATAASITGFYETILWFFFSWASAVV